MLDCGIVESKKKTRYVFSPCRLRISGFRDCTPAGIPEPPHGSCRGMNGSSKEGRQ